MPCEPTPATCVGQGVGKLGVGCSTFLSFSQKGKVGRNDFCSFGKMPDEQKPKKQHCHQVALTTCALMHSLNAVRVFDKKVA